METNTMRNDRINTKNVSYEEAVQYINDIPRFTKKNTLEHTRMFLGLLQVQEEQMKVIHVAGTNGKGTVCALIANVLKENKKKTGVCISPHLNKINERISINGEQISDEDFVRIFVKVAKMTNRAKKDGLPHPSYFEFLFLMAMTYFTEQQVEYVVLETGLGGRLDATNSIRKPILTVITSIGMDHMEYLGNTITEIAGEKAGIIKEGVPVVYWGEKDEVCQVIEKKAREMHSLSVRVDFGSYKITKKTDKSVAFLSLCEYYLNDTFEVPFIAEYQAENGMVALAAIAQLEDICHQTEKIHNAFQTVKWEGRMEQVLPGVIFDGAHNGPGIDAFIQTFQSYECNGTKSILFSVVKDKDYDYMIDELVHTDVAHVYVTGIDSERGLDTEEIYEKFQQKGCKAEVTVEHQVAKAFALALQNKGKEDVLFCVGSLYLVGELKQILENDK